jgi:hypothetical protein
MNTLRRGNLIALGLAIGLVSRAIAQEGCEADLAKFCPQMPPASSAYLQCLREHHGELSPACKDKLYSSAKTAEERTFLECQDNTTKHNPLLNPPASAQDVKFMRCGQSDTVVFRVNIPGADENIASIFAKRWETAGWLPTAQESPWESAASPDRLRIGKQRRIAYTNAKGQMAELVLQYYQKLKDPAAVGITFENTDLGSDLHVRATLFPVRRNFDGSLPRLNGREIKPD